MNQHIDTAARRSNARVKANAAATSARLENELIAFAKRVGHHGPAQFVEAVRQRHRVAITPEYAAHLISRSNPA
jgi:hypothetical protein